MALLPLELDLVDITVYCEVGEYLLYQENDVKWHWFLPQCFVPPLPFLCPLHYVPFLDFPSFADPCLCHLPFSRVFFYVKCFVAIFARWD